MKNLCLVVGITVVLAGCANMCDPNVGLAGRVLAYTGAAATSMAPGLGQATVALGQSHARKCHDQRLKEKFPQIEANQTVTRSSTQ